jgi:hypothetical protein
MHRAAEERMWMANEPNESWICCRRSPKKRFKPPRWSFNKETAMEYVSHERETENLLQVEFEQAPRRAGG